MGRPHWLSRREAAATHALFESERLRRDAERREARAARAAWAALSDDARSAFFEERRAAREGDAAGSYQAVPGQQCVYCGDAARVADHVPPLAALRSLPDGARWLYPACAPCNGALGAFPERCLKARWLHMAVRASQRGQADRCERLVAAWPQTVAACLCDVCEHERALVVQFGGEP